MNILNIPLLSVIFVSNTYAASWTGYVDTNTSSWSIEREGATIGFNLDSSVEGDISPIVGPNGRTLGAYHSYYSDLDVNDVRLSERTAAFEGQYSSEEVLQLRAETLEAVNLTATKPSGSDIWTISWYETWPVTLHSTKTIDYAGDCINNRDFVGNNLDYAGMSFLYNKEFSKDRKANLQLDKMNATVVATNDSIISANFMPTKHLGYEIKSYSTGIADLKYKQKSSQYDINKSDYVVVSKGAERYYGIYNITQKIEMKSAYEDKTEELNWLSCCLGSYYDADNLNTTWIAGRCVFDPSM